MPLPKFEPTSIILPALLTLAGLFLGFVVQRTVLRRLATAAAATSSAADDAIVAALRGPVLLWGTMVGLYLALEVSDLPVSMGRVARQSIMVLLILSVTWVIARLTGEILKARARADATAVHSSELVANLAKVVVLTVGALIILQTVGIAVTPLLTALGIGGLAIGLALQDTLANLFAGIHILLSRQVRRGDFIRLAEGQEGTVQDVRWRYTTIRQLSNVTIVPNAKLASAITANYNLPGAGQAVLIEASVGYDADLVAVERVAISVARDVVREVPGALPDVTPLIRFHTLDDGRVRFSVVLGARDDIAHYLLRHEFIKRLRARLKLERIQPHSRPSDEIRLSAEINRTG